MTTTNATIKVNVADITGLALNWAVCMAEGYSPVVDPLWNGSVRYGFYDSAIGHQIKNYSRNRDAGHEILDREGISIIRCDDDYGVDAQGYTTDVRIPVWCATTGQHSVWTSTEHQSHEPMYQIDMADVVYGPTPLISGLRCHVIAKLGKIIEVPARLFAA